MDENEREAYEKGVKDRDTEYRDKEIKRAHTRLDNHDNKFDNQDKQFLRLFILYGAVLGMVALIKFAPALREFLGP